MMALILLLAYLIGSVPFALLLARRWHVADLRQVGSGNLGAANVMRVSGVTAGILVALLDMTKGAASVWLAGRFTTSTVVPAAAGVAAIVGHIYPVWLRFRGGKGVATACGVFSLLTPLAVPPALAYVTGSSAAVFAAASVAATLIIFRHRSNLTRLRARTEPRMGARA